MTDYRCDHGFYAMGRDCPTCQQERDEARKVRALEEARKDRAQDEAMALRAQVEREKARADKSTAQRDRLAASLTRIADRCAAEDSHDMSREERRQAMRTISDDARAALAEVGK